MRSANFQFIIGVLCLLFASSALAGTGKIHDGKLDLSVMFTYYEPDPNEWRPMFEEASRLLYNATNGQLQLGTVRVLNCGYSKDYVDVWIRDNVAGAFANPLGIDGLGHIYLSQTHKSTSGGILGQFGLVHEVGHYAFGLFDEYKGVIEEALQLAAADFAPVRDDAASEQVTSSPTDWFFCTTKTDPVACIMDGGSGVAPDNRRTEFCTATSGGLSSAHNETTLVGGLKYVNAQEINRGESCWETIASTVGLSPPDTVDTADPPGLDPITWELVEDVGRSIICLDRSTSMTGGLFEMVKTAAIEMVDLFHIRSTVEVELPLGGTTTIERPGEELGVVSFAKEASVDFPMRELERNSDKRDARFTINGITRGSDTAIGDGLEDALAELISRSPVPGCNESIILISDGGQNSGTDPEEVIPLLQERGVKVFAVGVGNSPNVELLQNIALSTDGNLYLAGTPDELASVLRSVSSETRSGGLVVTESGETGGEDWKFPHINDGFGEELTSVLDWSQGWLDLELQSPSGDIIDLNSAPGRDDVYALIRASHIIIRVSDPEPGEWLLTVHAVTLPDTGSIHFDLTVLEESRTVSLTARTDRRIYDYPQPVKLIADVIGGVPVDGAQVEAIVERPDAAPTYLPLHDDGVAAHGDTFSGDGMYGAFFDDFSADGVYTFHIKATNETGTGPNPDLPFVEEGSDPTPIPIPPFTRQTEVSVLVRGVPEFIQGTVDIVPHTINAGWKPIWFFGRNIRAWIELPAPYCAGDIDLSTVTLNQTIPAKTWPFLLWDRNRNGVPERLARFNRRDVIDLLGIGVNIPVKVSGSLASGEVFEAEDSINIIDVHCGGSNGDAASLTISPSDVTVGSPATLSWDIPDGSLPWTAYTGYVSPDSGITWHQLFSGLTGTTSYSWNVDIAATTKALALVEAHGAEGVVRMAVSDRFRVIEGPSPREPIVHKTQFLNATPSVTTASTALSFSLAGNTRVRLDIFDVRGRLVKRLVSGVLPAGEHKTVWDGVDGEGRQVAAGVYFYIFEAEFVRKTGKIMLVR